MMGILRSCSLSNDASTQSHVNRLTGSDSDICWVHCLLPVANAGLCKVVRSSDSPVPRSSRFCIPLVRGQLLALRVSDDLLTAKDRTVRLLSVDDRNQFEPELVYDEMTSKIHSTENRYDEIEEVEQQVSPRRVFDYF